MLSKKMKYRSSIFIFIFLSFPLFLISQNKVHKKALKFQETAFDYFSHNDTAKARIFAIKAIEKDSLYAAPQVLLGNIYEMHGQIRQAVQSYKRATKIDSVNYPDLLYVIAELELKLKMFDASISYISKYLSLEKKSEIKFEQAEQLLKTVKFRQHAYQNPVAFNPRNLGTVLNSKNDEYVNSLSTDERTMYLTIKSDLGTEPQGRKRFAENIYETRLDSLNWMHPREVFFGDKPMYGAGAASVSPNNRYLFFTACNQQNGLGSCELYYAKINDGKFSEARSLGNIVNSASWDSQPCFSSDGEHLFFASKRKGGYGGSDIWIAELDKNGNFQAPQNAGSVINTSGDEMAPLIHYDAKTLYFSSNGRIGMGGFDLFMSRKLENDSWQEPKNLGYPVNTEKDEINLIVAPNGLSAYISSDQYRGSGGFDIYQFELSEPFRPDPVTYIRGVVYDSKTGEKLAAEVELTTVSSGEILSRSVSDEENGDFLMALPIGEMIAFNVSKTGYLFFSENYDLNSKGSKAEPVQIRIPLKRIVAGEILILNNIFFDTDQFDLKETSFPELDKLIRIMAENKNLCIEISGHTDNVGSRDYNLELSEKRAKAVVDYLVKNGVNQQRLNYRGMGFEQPIKTNETEYGRSKNRRTEVRILKN